MLRNRWMHIPFQQKICKQITRFELKFEDEKNKKNNNNNILNKFLKIFQFSSILPGKSPNVRLAHTIDSFVFFDVVDCVHFNRVFVVSFVIWMKKTKNHEKRNKNIQIPPILSIKCNYFDLHIIRNLLVVTILFFFFFFTDFYIIVGCLLQNKLIICVHAFNLMLNIWFDIFVICLELISVLHILFIHFEVYVKVCLIVSI